MKKVKIMLSAMAVLAIVGGALAFNAKKYGAFAFCSTTASPAGACNIALENITVHPQGTFATTYYCTTQPNLPCPLIERLSIDI